MKEKNNPNKIISGTYAVIATIVFLVLLVCILLAVIIKEKKQKNEPVSGVPTIENAANLNDNTTESNETLQVKKDKDIGEYFVLYKGYEIKKKTGVQTLKDMKINKNNVKKYNIEYYNYEDGEYKGETKGIFSKETQTYDDNLGVVDNVSKIATSVKYNAIPREANSIDTPDEIWNKMDYKGINTVSIDLDGDGKLEYIACGYSASNGTKYSTKSEICLFDSKYNKIATLAHWENEVNERLKGEDDTYYLQLNNIEYIDIDNDGIMEILISIPQWEGEQISIVKYKDNKIEGKTDVKVDITP